jgi:hypothetical protein
MIVLLKKIYYGRVKNRSVFPSRGQRLLLPSFLRKMILLRFFAFAGNKRMKYRIPAQDAFPHRILVIDGAAYRSRFRLGDFICACQGRSGIYLERSG